MIKGTLWYLIPSNVKWDFKTNQLVGTATRTPNNIYILDDKDENCYVGNEDESWLWNKRLGHINFDNLI